MVGLQIDLSNLISGTWLAAIPIDWWATGKMGFQLGVLVGLVYFIYSRFVRHSQADRLLKGLFLVLLSLLLCWSVARLFALPLLEMVFGASLQLLIIGLIVIFQPELRRILLVLGQTQWFHIATHEPLHQGTAVLVKELSEAIRFLSKSKTGAIIVLEKPNETLSPTSAYLEAGTPMNADVSMELLLTIFHINTPLHDGAVVIDSNNRLAAAGVLLPLTEDPSLSWRFGTRHRAAIGLTEQSNSHCIVVSEETGHVSYVQEGELQRLNKAGEIQELLQAFYDVDTAELNHQSKPIWSRPLSPIREGADVLQSHLQNLLSFSSKNREATGGKPSVPGNPQATQSSERN